MFSTITTEEKAQIVALYGAGLGATSIARQLGRSELFVKYNLKKQGVTIRKVADGCYRKYKVNTHYFDEVDTPEKAYWLGFLYADGYNLESRNTVKLCLGTLDREHLAAFLRALDSDLPIKETAGNKRDNTCQINVCSSVFSRALAKQGCTQAKSFTIRFPDLNEAFVSSFALGMFDGDGSISCSNLATKANPSFTLTSCYDFCLDYQKVLISHTGVNQTKLYTKKGDNRDERHKAYGICYCGRGNVRKICNWLYSSPVTCYLKRKKCKFEELLTPV